MISPIDAGTESKILSGELARDAIILAEKQSESVKTGTVVIL